MAIAIALVFIVVGAVLFHIYSPWWITPLASNWNQMDATLIITIWITGAVFIAINLFIAYSVIRFRHKPGRRAAYEPENKKLEGWLVGLTTVGVVAMLAPGLYVYAQFLNVPEDASLFEVAGQQWGWSFRFPGDDGVLGSVDPQRISPENPFGLNSDDPNGQDDVLVQGGEVHLPLGRPVQVLLRSKDVLHSFYVPHFRVKMDAVPGLVPSLWFTPTTAGTFEIACAEYCGMGHYAMRGRVVVEEEGAFQAWLKTHPTFAGAPAGGVTESAEPPEEQGRHLAEAKGCLGCHSVDGSPGVGPTWQGLFGKSEKLVDGNTVVVDEAYLKESILHPGAAVVQGYQPIMPAYEFDDEQLEALIAYTRNLSK